MKTRLKLYLDVDDTILDSTEAVVEILNEKYPENTHTADDIVSTFEEAYPKMKPEEMATLFSSETFFERVHFNKKFISFLKENRDKFDFAIVTKGNAENLRLKKKFFATFLPEATVIGLPFEAGKSKFDKSFVDMSDGIQIDDRCECLDGSNAHMKCLITNGRRTKWNIYRGNGESVYIFTDWGEIGEFLNFLYDEREFY